MRIARLDLLRYGRFTDRSVDFSAGRSDLHVVFGPNEAGKSTARSAIEDLLFGIPHTSSLNFRHDYPSMRIGARLEGGGETLEMRRRKGNRDTVLGTDDLPLAAGEAALARLLAGADRAFLGRMFSLDHESLRAGGNEILGAQDDTGQMLFAASAGLRGLGEVRQTLDDEAERLWGKRRAGHRRYFQAETRLEEADRALRAHVVPASRWQELRDASERGREAYEQLDHSRQELAAEKRKLERIARVHGKVRALLDLERTIAELGGAPRLEAGAAEALRAARQAHESAAQSAESLERKLVVARAECDALRCDEALLLHAQDIKILHERRIAVRSERADLPKRQLELATAEGGLARLAAELGWPAGDAGNLVARIPPRPRIREVRELIGRRAALRQTLDTATTALAAAEKIARTLRERADRLPPAGDVSGLAAAVRAARDRGDLGARRLAASGRADQIRAGIARRLASLSPAIADEASLERLAPPPRETILELRDALRTREQGLRQCRDRIAESERDLERARRAYLRAVDEDGEISAEALAAARARRDAGWELVRRHHLGGEAVADDELLAFTGAGVALADAYTEAVRQADSIADRRFERAEAAGRLAADARQIAEREDTLEILRRERADLEREHDDLQARWRSLWTEAPFAPLGPDEMLAWLENRDAILAARRGLDDLRTEQEGVALQENAAAESILAELTALGAGGGELRERPLPVLLEFAGDEQRRREEAARTRTDLEEQIRVALDDAGERRRALERAEKAWTEWSGEWSAAVAALDLDGTAEAAGAQLDVIEEMRDAVRAIETLRVDRILKIERDIASFGAEVARLVAAVAPDLAALDAEDAMLAIEGRLSEAEKVRERRSVQEKSIAEMEGEFTAAKEGRDRAREAISRLQEAAGAGDLEQLVEAVERSDRLRAAEEARAQIAATLADIGDGMPLADLIAECAGVDADEAAAREQSLAEELRQLDHRWGEAREDWGRARDAFEAVGGENAAARAAAARQEALAEMREAAAHYVRVRAAGVLLRWAIERFRREKQAPLLGRAGALFARLTAGSFAGLSVAFDDQDRPRLTGVRPGGEVVGVAGMSHGTADQLYLALRVASVEEYLERATPLPFVADDLFVHFDDRRAAAGLEVLAELAERTQVLFFTHHRHLVDLARACLGSDLAVVELDGDSPGSR